MLDYEGVCRLAKEMKAPTSDLLAMVPINDPFFAERNGRRKEAEWFAETCRTLGLGAGLHVRRVHYRASISPPVPILKPDGSPYENNHHDWMLMLRASRDARYLGLVPAEWFIDRHNADPIINAEFYAGTAPSIEVMSCELAEMELPAQLDLPELVLSGFNAQQRCLVEIWVEKTTVHDVLVPLSRRWGVNLVTFKGEGSETACRAAIERARQARRPLRILYLSDHDPGGRSMPVAIARKIEYWLTAKGDKEIDVTIDPLVLLPEQIEQYHLPRIPIKATERRASRFQANFGAGGVEIDALEALHPGELRKIVEAGILRYLDPDLKEREREASRVIYRYIGDAELTVHHQYQARVDAVQDAYQELRQKLLALRDSAADLWQQMVADLNAAAPYVDVNDVPEARDESDQLTPMFDSDRDYLTQLDWYRRWQGRP